MASILLHPAEEGVTLTAQAVKCLLERGDGDAALLYLALLKHRGAMTPRALAGELRWEKAYFFPKLLFCSIWQLPI